jgi:uncharacterized tellurite resistance protein B-like protein
MSWEILLKNREKLISLNNSEISKTSISDLIEMLEDLEDEAKENYEFTASGSIDRDYSNKITGTKETLSGDFTDSEVTPQKIRKILNSLYQAEADINKLRDSLN